MSNNINKASSSSYGNEVTENLSMYDSHHNEHKRVSDAGVEEEVEGRVRGKLWIFQNGVTEESPKRHNSMDQIMGLFNDLGKSSRQRSLSDGDHEIGKKKFFLEFKVPF